MKHRVIGD